MAIITGFVVIGGTKRVGRFCMGAVPFMSILYIVGGLIVVAGNYERLPEVLGLIMRYAFAPASAMGGFTGSAVARTIQVGMSRGMLSNEAGQGTASMAHATTHTDHPFQEGVWGVFFELMKDRLSGRNRYTTRLIDASREYVKTPH